MPFGLVRCRNCGNDVTPHTQCGACGVRHLTRLFERMRSGQRWKSRFNGDTFEIRNVDSHDGRLDVIWNSNLSRLDRVMSYDLGALDLKLEQA